MFLERTSVCVDRDPVMFTRYSPRGSHMLVAFDLYYIHCFSIHRRKTPAAKRNMGGKNQGKPLLPNRTRVGGKNQEKPERTNLQRESPKWTPSATHQKTRRCPQTPTGELKRPRQGELHGSAAHWVVSQRQQLSFNYRRIPPGCQSERRQAPGSR